MRVLYLLMALGWLVVANGFAQPNVPSASTDSTNGLTVRLWTPQMAEPPHAPANIRMFADVSVEPPAHKGDIVQIEFFNGTNRLSSATSLWREAIKPDPHSARPQPMIVMRAGFSGTAFVWTNAPAGSHTLTARASLTNGLSAVSPPANVLVQP